MTISDDSDGQEPFVRSDLQPHHDLADNLNLPMDLHINKTQFWLHFDASATYNEEQIRVVMKVFRLLVAISAKLNIP